LLELLCKGDAHGPGEFTQGLALVELRKGHGHRHQPAIAPVKADLGFYAGHFLKIAFNRPRLLYAVHKGADNAAGAEAGCYNENDGDFMHGVLQRAGDRKWSRMVR
jgi:hypothetical protein